MSAKDAIARLGARRETRWGIVALSALTLVAFVFFSRDMTGTGGANTLLVLAFIVAVAVAVALRFVRGRPVREWSTLFLTFAIVYAILASFSLRQGELAENYLVEVGFTVAIFSIFALGLSLEMGHAGLLNFGHVAFMLIGGYTVALVMRNWAEGWATAFEGSGPGAVLMTVFTALVVAVLVYAPLQLLTQRLPLRKRWRVALAALPGLALGAWLGYSMFPLDERGAMAVVALLAVFMGVAFAAFAGLFLGVASLRLREDYLAIVTLGSAEILRILATNLRDFTNGSLGIQLATAKHHMPIASWARENDWFKQWSRDTLDVVNFTLLANAIVALVVLLYAFLILEVLGRSPWGRVLKAIREDDQVASALGKNVLRYRLQALMIGSALAAIAGMLFVWKKNNVYPSDFLPTFTFYAVAILILGGIANHKGAILGAVILWGIFQFAGSMNNAFADECTAGDASWFVDIFCDFAGPKQQLLVGLVLILVVMFRPQGAVGNKEELAHAK